MVSYYGFGVQCTIIERCLEIGAIYFEHECDMLQMGVQDYA